MESVVQALQDASNQGDNALRAQGEEQLSRLGQHPGFLTSLLEIYTREGLDESVRLLAVIHFKNSIDKVWRKAGAQASPEERQAIRDRVFNLSELPLPKILSRQLSVAAARIAKHDFPRSWPSLFDEMKARIVAALSSDNVLSLQGLLMTCYQIVKAIATARIGPARALFNDVTPDFLNLASQAYFHLMGKTSAGHPNQIEFLSTAHSCLKINGILLYDGNDRIHRQEAGTEFFAQTLAALKSLMESWMINREEIVAKQIKRFGKIYNRLVENRPISFCLMPGTLGVLEFYHGLIVDHKSNDSDDDGERKELYDMILIQGMSLLRHTLMAVQRDPSNTRAPILPLNMRPRDQQDIDDLSRAYDLIRNQYLQQSDVVPKLLMAILETYFVMRESDMELWSEDPEDFIIEEINSSHLFRTNVSAQLLFGQVLKVFPELSADVLKFVEAKVSVESTELRDVLLLDSALQALQYGSHTFHTEFQIQPMLAGVLAPRLGTVVVDSYRIIRRRVCMLMAEWMPLQSSPELVQFTYRLIVELIFVKSSLNDLPVELAALDLLKVTVDDVDFDVEMFLPYAEICFAKIYDLLNNTVRSLDVKRHILAVLSVLVEQLGPQLSMEHIRTILDILPPLWEEVTDNQLIKGVILQTLMHLVDAAKEKSPIAYPLAIQALQVSVDPASPLFSYLFEDALGVWKSLVVNATIPNDEVMSIFPHVLTLLTTNTEHLSEELAILESYIHLQPAVIADGPTTAQIFGLFASYLPESSIEITMSILSILESMTSLSKPEEYLVQLRDSGLASVLTNLALAHTAEDGDITLGIRANKILGVAAWVSYYDPNGFMNTLPTQAGVVEAFISLWTSKLKSIPDPRDKKIHTLGLSSTLLANPSLFLQHHDAFTDLWAAMLEEIVETDNGDAEIYHFSGLYPGETDQDLSPEQLRIRAQRLEEPVHTVGLRPWLTGLITKLRELPDPGYRSVLDSWAARTGLAR